MALFRSFLTVGGFTLISRVTGFLRDMMIANFLGAGFIADCFFVAQRMPNLFRSLFAEGAFSAAFVPQFSATLEREGEERARYFASQAFTVLGLTLALFTALFMIAMPLVMIVFAPGFQDIPGKSELASDLSRINFPYLLFISLCSLLSGILNSLGRFAAAAGTPILLNLVMMAALLVLTPFVPTSGHALSIGVSLAGVCQFSWLMVSVRRAGMVPRLVRPRLTPEVKALVARIVPVAFGAGLYQVSLVVSTMLASMISDGAVSYLYYADRINQLPLGVVGIAVGTALLPMMSRQLAAGNAQGALDSQNRSVEFALFLTLPAMAALMSLSGPIITVLFRHGAFSAEDAAATSQALAAFTVGLPAYVLVKVFTPGFYAREDTKTPVRIAMASLLANLVLNIGLMQVLGHVGIALGTALASCLNAFVLAFVLIRRGHYSWDARLRQRVPRILASTVVMAAGLLALQALAEQGAAMGIALPNWLVLGIEIAVGGMLYFGMSLLTGAIKRSDLGPLRRRRGSAS